MQLMPCVRNLEMGSDHLNLNKSAITADVQWSGCTTSRMQEALTRIQNKLQLQIPLTVNCLSLSSEHPELHCDESYKLEVDTSKGRITISANTEWGILRSFATLSQLIQDSMGGASPTSVKCCKIEDGPAFPWRGLMLDPARHFLPVPVLEETLDLMFLFKLNVLHLHLSDDQGFRFFSTTYPELAELGGDGDYYTTDQLKKIVLYASERGIRIVPELDVPGHCTSWLAAKPEWGAGKVLSDPGIPSPNFGGHKACLDPTNPQVYKAMGILLDELTEVFPDEYVHLGGDEVNPEWWGKDASIQEYVRSEQLESLSDLQNQFMTRIASLAHDRGKKVIGWDEILHPELSTSVVIQSWRTAKYRDIALENGFDCIFSSAYYLDLFYPADIHYGFTPDAGAQELQNHEDGVLNDARLAHIQGLNRWLAKFHADAANSMPGTAKKRGRILGGEACMWAELVTEDLLHTRIWSRMPAIAERLWSVSGNSKDMYTRLEASWAYMKESLGINIYGPIEEFIASFDAVVEERRLLTVLLHNLEPVKGYARLLGDQANARVSGTEVSADRPYKCSTPLNRVVDLLPPESLSARKSMQMLLKITSENTHPATNMEIRSYLKEQAMDWCEQLRVVRKLMIQDSRLAEILPLSESLAYLGELLATHLTTGKSEIFLTTTKADHPVMQPACELILPVALGFSKT